MEGSDVAIKMCFQKWCFIGYVNVVYLENGRTST